MKPGDVYVLNAPYNGGTHLPDVTVITPVFDEKGSEILFYVGSRGHHADIGGITPGSMPPDSKTVEEEGVLLDNFLLVEEGASARPRLRALLVGAVSRRATCSRTSPTCRRRSRPTRRACRSCARWSRTSGWTWCSAYMRHVQDNAEESVRRVIDVLKDGEFELPLDNGAKIRVRSVDRRTAQRDDRLHRHLGAAAEQLQRAAAVSDGGGAVRLPHAGGRRHPAERRLPEAARHRAHPRGLDAQSRVYPAAVVAGNVETSQASPMRCTARSACWPPRRAR
jgi:5-oxoprolinase (ATP-hydrolysing)